MYIKSLEDNGALNETNEESLKSAFATVTTESGRLGQLFDGTCAEAVDLQEELATRDAVAISVIEDSCATLKQSLRGLVENSVQPLISL